MKEGIVDVYFVGNSRQYGFMTTEDGKQVYFHANNHRSMLPGLIAPSFGKKTKPKRNPMKGDRLVFEAIQGRRRLTAERWCFKNEYDDAIEEARSARD